MTNLAAQEMYRQRLYASAPDMLKILKKMCMELYHESHYSQCECGIEEARTIIARIEGIAAHEEGAP